MMPISAQQFQNEWPRYGYTLAVNLRALRLARGLTQEKLAHLAGMSRSAISNLERNESNQARSADPTMSTIYRLSAALQVTPAELLPEVDEVVLEYRASWPLARS
ncbi:helix-turn-helix domain-containing protein [Corynebacterium guangdongense]|uniref:Transcriptional regulator with XRE-family HTH domain n=1 Tax=Corynebacterium guangdongense TaxID=1783348 RepID=A0ABU1ZUN8_9CORY|nr:helix-turn-helix transcriptional regulator [Corynebacterium guangdongense]MDR7328642.1 transcriptional regulator with XRE-family HTH domain [Corynebacterium guangdongense]WJZ17219.1 anaerobic benzoate catabolism transcriptional regulator [Corynebacterium guangdongense]